MTWLKHLQSVCQTGRSVLSPDSSPASAGACFLPPAACQRLHKESPAPTRLAFTLLHGNSASMAACWKAQQTCCTATPSLLASSSSPTSPVYYIYHQLSLHSSSEALSAFFCKPWPAYSHSVGILIHLKLSKWWFSHSFFLFRIRYGIFRGALRSCFLLGLMLYYSFSESTHSVECQPPSACFHALLDYLASWMGTLSCFVSLHVRSNTVGLPYHEVQGCYKYFLPCHESYAFVIVPFLVNSLSQSWL